MVYVFVKNVKVLFFLKSTYLRSACAVRRSPSAVRRLPSAVRRPPPKMLTSTTLGDIPINPMILNQIFFLTLPLPTSCKQL
ncbi:MAG TPA: hypothetical protein ENJ53_11100 [Phaeodactylibacter sp.]|nr:hypothetical protein [Phaeodactylibacter sp.]